MDYNILYFAFVGNSFGGVEQKIIAQYDALSLIRPNTRLYLVSTSQPGSSLETEIQKRSGIHLIINSSDKRRNPYSRRKEKFDLIYRVLLGYKPNETICYFRYPNADFLFLQFLKKCKDFKIITEHQEIENTFSKGIFNGNYLRNTFELLWGKSVRSYITGFVGVTPEITEYELSVAGEKNKFSFTNGNGIDVSKYPARKPDQSQKNIIKILFVGAGFRTHGLHRLLRSITDYYLNQEKQHYDIILKIAGESDEMKWNKKLADKFIILDKVDFMGNCSGTKLDALYNWADIALFTATDSNGPNTLIECMASGTGVILSKYIHNTGAYAIDKENCFICDLDTQRFVDAITQYIENDGLIEKHGAISKKLVANRSIQATAKLYSEIIEQNLFLGTS